MKKVGFRLKKDAGSGGALDLSRLRLTRPAQDPE
jgi:hypothetical protein